MCVKYKGLKLVFVFFTTFPNLSLIVFEGGNIIFNLFLQKGKLLHVLFLNKK